MPPPSTPPRTPPAASTPNLASMSDQELRRKLKPVFEKFDLDHSGFVSTEEMGAMIRLLKMDMSDEQIAQLMADADPDDNGQIDFDEFVVVLKKQLSEGGGGGLANVFSSMFSFGWLNPVTWFAPSKPEEAEAGGGAGESSVSASARRQRAPPTPPGWLRGMPPLGVPQEEAPLRLSQIGYAQWVVQAGNRLTADEMREEEESRKSFKQQQQQQFLAMQQQRIKKMRKDEARAAHEAEQQREHKRQIGTHMARSIKVQVQYTQQLDQYHVHTKAHEIRTEKRVNESKKSQRILYKKKVAAAHGQAEQEARAARREHAKSTKNKEFAAAKDHTARVRHETRPAVRQEGRDMFQAQRDAIAATVAETSLENQDKIAWQREQFVAEHAPIRKAVKAADAVAKQARLALAAQRKADADALREQLAAEKERKRRLGEEMKQSYSEKHSAVFESRFASEDAVETVRQGPLIGAHTGPVGGAPMSTPMSTGSRSTRRGFAIASPMSTGRSVPLMFSSPPQKFGPASGMDC